MRLLPVLRKGERVLAAVSGGPDSVCLLRLLCALRDDGFIALEAAHFNHGIRGAEADGDQAFVEDLCRELGVRLALGYAPVPALAARNGRGMETQARESRRAFLLEALERGGGDVIATAHHAQDQAETVLMHLLRGAGLKGAGGMAAREGRFCRPLLEATKAQILACLEDMGQPYRLDATNGCPDNPRNALRLEVMPSLRRIYPGGEAALGRFARLAAQAGDYLEEQARAYLDRQARGTPWGGVLDLEAVHPAVLCQALALWTRAGDFDRIQALMALCGKDRGALAWGPLRFERTGTRLYRIDARLEPPGQSVPLGHGAGLTGLGHMEIAPWQGGPIGENPWVQAADAAALAGAVLRTRRPGDRIHPLGGPGSRKLSDVLVDKGVDRPLRDYLPLVARGQTVLWAVGVCLAQQAAITEATANQVRLEWKKEEYTPWTTPR